MSYHDESLNKFREEYRQVKEKFRETDFPKQDNGSAVMADPWAEELPVVEEASAPINDWTSPVVDDVLDFDGMSYHPDIPRGQISGEDFYNLVTNDVEISKMLPEMEGIYLEIGSRMMDPNDPMTQEEAMQQFSVMMTEKFGKMK